MKTILSIDCGTQSIRAILFDDRGRLIAKEQVKYAPYVSPAPGWAEQDPQVYWDGLVTACRALREKERQGIEAVRGIGVTTQRASMINVDANGEVLRPAILWMDQRRSAMGRAGGGIQDKLLRLAGSILPRRSFAGTSRQARSGRRTGFDSRRHDLSPSCHSLRLESA